MPWIYKYIRVDLEEIDVGLFETQQDAKQAKQEHASFGAVTQGPFQVAEDYELYKGSQEAADDE